MTNENVKICFLGNENLEKPLKSFIAQGLQMSENIEIIIPTKKLMEADWDEIEKIFDTEKINWLIIETMFLLGNILLNEEEAVNVIEKLMISFAKNFGEGIIIWQSINPEWRKKIKDASYSTRLQPIFIKELEDLQVVVKPKHHLTLWIENDHIHSFAQKHMYAPAVGKKEHSANYSINNFGEEPILEKVGLSVFVELAKDIRNYKNSNYKEFAQEIGNEFKNYLKEQLGVENFKEDIMNKFLSTPYVLRSFGPIHIIPENSNHFPLPFEFISSSDYTDEMWGFQNPVVHQIPQASPPEMFLPDNNFNVLLIDASAKKDVKSIILLDDESKPKRTINLEKPLRCLNFASKEISELNKKLNSRERSKAIKYKTRKLKDRGALIKEIQGDKDRFNVVHFAGHSVIINGEVCFHWPTAKNDSIFITLNQLRKLLSGNYPLLLFLSSCEVGQHETLLKLGDRIPFIIAHRWPLKDRQGFEFSMAFYENILDGVTNPAEALMYTKLYKSELRASLSAIFVCGRKSIEPKYN